VTTPEEIRSETPVLDGWRAEVGDESIAAMVDAEREKTAQGASAGFSAKHQFLEHLRDLRRRAGSAG
jgi:hypothetical protein